MNMTRALSGQPAWDKTPPEQAKNQQQFDAGKKAGKIAGSAVIAGGVFAGAALALTAGTAVVKEVATALVAVAGLKIIQGLSELEKEFGK